MRESPRGLSDSHALATHALTNDAEPESRGPVARVPAPCGGESSTVGQAPSRSNGPTAAWLAGRRTAGVRDTAPASRPPRRQNVHRGSGRSREWCRRTARRWRYNAHTDDRRTLGMTAGSSSRTASGTRPPLREPHRTGTGLGSRNRGVRTMPGAATAARERGQAWLSQRVECRCRGVGWDKLASSAGPPCATLTGG